MFEDYATLVECAQRNLSPDLLKRQYSGSSHPLAGHCYVASEAIYHLLTGPHTFKPCSAQDGQGGVHWWLQDDAGSVLDPTAAQYENPPYSAGRRRGFLTKAPSRRAAELIRRMSLDNQYDRTHT